METNFLIESLQVSAEKAEMDGAKLIAKQKELTEVAKTPSELDITKLPIIEEEMRDKPPLESEQVSKERKEEIEQAAKDIRPGSLTSPSAEEAAPALKKMETFKDIIGKRSIS